MLIALSLLHHETSLFLYWRRLRTVLKT
jgi:hypothetical protein